MYCLRLVGLAAAAAAGVVAAVPLPSSSQLAWTQFEVGVMISYEYVTQFPNITNPQVCGLRSEGRPLHPLWCYVCVLAQYFCLGAGGNGGWVPPPSLFNPANLSTDQVRGMERRGGGPGGHAHGALFPPRSGCGRPAWWERSTPC